MLYIGCDVHRNYTTTSFITERGDVIETCSFHNDREELKKLLEKFPDDRFSAVLEAGLNWGVIYDLLESMEKVDKVALAHPPKVKAIASAKIKTDKIDSRTLGKLLRAGLIPEVWVPPREMRVLKDMVRYRAFVVKLKTMVKNRVHDVLRKAHVQVPGVQDLFGSYGRRWLEEITLSDDRENELLRCHLRMYDFFKEMERQLRRWIEREMRGDEETELVRTIPGIGEIFAPIIVLEIGDIRRFPDAAHLHSYSGLVPSTHISGSTQYHGRLIRGNRWLRWAFIEGAHTSVKVSPYFREHYNRVKRNAGSQAASISSARRLAAVVYRVLKTRRDYREIYARKSERRLPSKEYSPGIPGSGQE